MQRFSRFPLLKIAPPFVSGCLMASCGLIQIELKCLLIMLSLSISCIFVFGNSVKSQFAIISSLIFLLLGLTVSIAKQPKHSDYQHYTNFSIFDSNVVILGSPDGWAKTTSYGKKQYFNLHFYRLDGRTRPTCGRILVHIKASNNKTEAYPGGLYAFTIKLRMPLQSSIPNGFDMRNYLENNGVYHECWINQSEIRLLKSPYGLTAISNRCKLYVDELMVDKIKNIEDLGVASALLLGNENWLDQETENNFSAAGVLHVLCVSGMHLVLLYGILIKLFKPTLRIKPLTRHFVFPFLLCCIWFYSILTGMSPSITRAATMTTFVVLSDWLGRKVDKTNFMCASMILLSCLDPLMVLSAGFQLSFLAVCGIFYLHPIILSAFEPENRISRQVWEMTSVTLAAQLVTFPLSLLLFGQFPNWFLLANMVIVPVSSIVMYLGILLVMLGNTPWVGEWIGSFTSSAIQVLRYLVEFISNLPYAVSDEVYYPVLMVVSTYMVIFMLGLFLKNNSFNYLIGILISLVFLMFTIMSSVHDFENENSCWVSKAKSGPVFIKQQGLSAEIIADSSISDATIQQIKNTLSTKRNVHFFKNTRYNTTTILNLKKYNALFLHSLPKSWQSNEPLLKRLKTTRILILGKQLQEGFFGHMDQLMPNLKNIILLKRFHISKKNYDKAKNMGIQLYSLDQVGFVEL